MMDRERRRYPRLKTTAIADISVVRKTADSRQRLPGLCLDLSINGALITSGAGLAEGEVITVRLNLNSETVECGATIQRSIKDARTGRWKIGCQFQPVPEEIRLKLDSFLLDRFRSTIEFFQ